MADTFTLTCTVPTQTNREASISASSEGVSNGNKISRFFHSDQRDVRKELLESKLPFVTKTQVDQLMGLEERSRTLEYLAVKKLVDLRKEHGEEKFGEALKEASKESLGFIPGNYYRQKLE